MLDNDFEEKLRLVQKKIAEKVVLEDNFKKPISTVAGFDLSFLNDEAYAVGVVLDYKKLNLLEIKSVKSKLRFPYVPTFLAFREGPSIIKVYKKLKVEPDVLLINGQGIAHPLFCGIASHVGVLLNKPSIGVAQTKLCGEFREPEKVGEYAMIIYKNKKVGYAYKSRKGCRPIFISPGHRITLRTSLNIVKSTIKNHKLPEPIFIAHSVANKIKISNSK